MLLLVKEVRPREDSDSSTDSDMDSDSEGGKESNPAVSNVNCDGGEPSSAFKRKFPCMRPPQSSLAQLNSVHTPERSSPPCAHTPAAGSSALVRIHHREHGSRVRDVPVPETQRTSREHTRARPRPHLNCFADSSRHVRHHLTGRRSAPPAAGPGG